MSEPLQRREFLQQMTGMVGIGWLTDSIPSPVSHRQAPVSDLLPADKLSRIGVQLYTVRRAMQAGVEQAIGQVARMGYKEVEFAGFFGKTAKEMRAILDANGLTSPSSHSADINSIRTRFAQVLEDAATVGNRYVICASLPRDLQTIDGFKRAAADFNKAGEQAAAAGITLGYHNHDFEFRAQDGMMGYDVLLAECDPKLVTMQMDLFWTRRGGQDPLAYFAKHPGRFTSVHVKDMDAAGNMVAVGDGQLPFGSYFRQAAQAGIQHYFVEHDNPEDPMASIERSFRHLAALEY